MDTSKIKLDELVKYISTQLEVVNEVLKYFPDIECSQWSEVQVYGRKLVENLRSVEVSFYIHEATNLLDSLKKLAETLQAPVEVTMHANSMQMVYKTVRFVFFL